MFFQKTLRIDDELELDENNKLLRYKQAGEYVVLSVKNIMSCVVSADIDEIDNNLFYSAVIEPFGEIGIVKDNTSFIKALNMANAVLVIYYLDKEGKVICHRKKYLNKEEKAYNDAARKNKIIN